MALMKCPECQSEISDMAPNCPKCGYTFAKMKFCKFCGERIPVDNIICNRCGRQVENQQNSSGITINNTSSSCASSSASVMGMRGKRKDKIVALILCICLGLCGGHKFYEGKIGMGILYLLTFGLCGIGWLVDIVIIATKPNPYYV